VQPKNEEMKFAKWILIGLCLVVSYAQGRKRGHGGRERLPIKDEAELVVQAAAASHGGAGSRHEEGRKKASGKILIFSREHEVLLISTLLLLLLLLLLDRYSCSAKGH
jgi:hypothetical protein